jgi:hypothetical protein
MCVYSSAEINIGGAHNICKVIVSVEVHARETHSPVRHAGGALRLLD